MKSSFLTRISLTGARGSALDLARGRLVLVSAFFALAYIMIAARVVDLTMIQGELQNGMEREAFARPAEEKALRADITDRNGVLLATSLKTASLYADPALITEPEKTAQGLAALFPDLTYGEALRKLQSAGHFEWIRRNLTPQEQGDVLLLGDPGLKFEEEMRRIYPQGPLAAHIAGYTDIDGRGLGGMERSFDRMLAEGRPVRLTLDIRIQHILRREMMKAVGAFSAAGGAGVVMDMGTGEVLAAVSLPDFDPHDPGATGQKALFNRVTLGVYELGSVFKIFSTAAFLETQKGGLGMSFDAREPLERGKFSITDYHAQERILTVPEIFIHSSNIGAALMGEAVGTEALKSFYEDLGLLSPPRIGIEEVGKPLYPDPWRDISTTTAAYGHGIAVSPLQMTAAAASIAGDGTLLRPMLVLDVAAEKNPPSGHDLRIVSPQTAHRMRQLLRLTVTDGTGKDADIPGYRIGGKTGTAEQPGGRGYDRKRLISSFMGFFPMEAPRYAVFVMIDEPKGTKASFGYATGGWVAAPAAAGVVAGMAAVLGVEPLDIPPEADVAAPLKQYVHDPKGESHLASY